MLWLLLLLVAGVAFLVFKRRKAEDERLSEPNVISRPSTPVHVPVYRKRTTIMNNSERAFFYELKKQLPSGYHIFPNMRIADMIQAIDGAGFYSRRNKILPKHIDFLVCDEYFRPVVAVEVNGSSHRRPDRIERDEQVRSIFEDAKLPLKFVDVGTSFPTEIEKVVSGIIRANGAAD